MSESDSSQPKAGNGAGAALNSLRNFRFQKKKLGVDSDVTSDTSHDQDSEKVLSDADSPVKPAGGKRILESDNDNSPVKSQNGANRDSEVMTKPAHKRIRVLSDSEPENSPVKLDVPLAEEIETKVNFLQNAYPDMDPMVLQDTLKYERLPMVIWSWSQQCTLN